MFEIVIYVNGDYHDSNRFRSIIDAQRWGRAYKVKGKTTKINFIELPRIKREYTGFDSFGE